jgi:hypothetical protein
MHRTDFKKFLEDQIHSQGTASSMALTELANELLQHVPCVLHIADTSSMAGSSTVYKVTDPQSEINDIIYEIGNTEMAHVVVHNKGVTLHFDHIEVEDDLVICYLVVFDGVYTLTLSKEDGMSELSHTPNITK